MHIFVSSVSFDAFFSSLLGRVSENNFRLCVSVSTYFCFFVASSTFSCLLFLLMPLPVAVEIEMSSDGKRG